MKWKHCMIAGSIKQTINNQPHGPTFKVPFKPQITEITPKPNLCLRSRFFTDLLRVH